MNYMDDLDREKDNNSNIYKSNKNQKNNQKNDSSSEEKAAHVVGKGAGEYFAPGVGGKVYDKVSKTPIGKQAEKSAGKLIKANPALSNSSKILDKSGGLDTIDKGIDSISSMNSGKKSGSKEDKNTSFGKIPSLLSGMSDGGNSDMSGEVNGDTEDVTNRSAFSMISDFIKKNHFFLAIFGPSFFSFLITSLLILVALCGILSLGYIAEDLFNNVSGFFDKLENFVTFNGFVNDEEKAYNAKLSFYKKLDTVRTQMRSKYSVEIDVTLIEATLFYNQGIESELGFMDGDDDQEGDFNDTTKFYKEAKKKIKQLAKMQILKTITENSCSDPVKEAEMDPRSDEEIARDYQNQFLQFDVATKKNKVYHAYDVVTKEDGSTETVCNHNNTEESYSLSIKREGIYYYNLISPRLGGKSFLEKYYKEELGNSFQQGDLKEVVDDIYDLYEYIRSTNKKSYASSYAACPNGITVISGTKGVGHHTNPSKFPIGTFDLEEYIAMVVNGENNSGQVEAMKAQIIAARTYTLARTNNCTKPIRNSTQDQVAKANPSEQLKQLVEETAGMVLLYEGNIFSAEYDSFKGSCSGGMCTGTYTRLPNGEKHTVTMPSSFSEGIGGHGRGMSQCAANYMSSQGSTYEEILKFFYSDGVEISYLSGGSSALAVANADWSTKAQFLFPSGIPTSESQMSQYLARYPVQTLDGNGNIVNRNITTHKALQADLENIFREISSTGFPISDLYCYTWRQMNGSSSRSHHSYGIACDINVSANPFIKGGTNRTGGSWQPGVNPYSIEPDGPVVKIFNNYGWIWGGNWKSSKDYMHFSFSGH